MSLEKVAIAILRDECSRALDVAKAYGRHERLLPNSEHTRWDIEVEITKKDPYALVQFLCMTEGYVYFGLKPLQRLVDKLSEYAE